MREKRNANVKQLLPITFREERDGKTKGRVRDLML